MAKRKKDRSSGTPVVVNRRARFDYFIHDTLEVGIKFCGSEIKSVRAGNISISEGYVRVQGDPLGLSLHGVTIAEYAPAASLGHSPLRSRVLLAHKREILKLLRQVERKGVTIVPLRLYFKNGYAKLEIGVAEGKHKGDKRRALAERDVQRDMQRAMTRGRVG